MPKCAVCGRSDIPLFRANAKGVAAIWACRPHLATPPPLEVEQLVNAIAAQGEDKSHA